MKNVIQSILVLVIMSASVFAQKTNGLEKLTIKTSAQWLSFSYKNFVPAFLLMVFSKENKKIPLVLLLLYVAFWFIDL
ncbi:MAG: hypothetical protein AB7O47_11700, partial [Flavobacteriales bacterium]